VDPDALLLEEDSAAVLATKHAKVQNHEARKPEVRDPGMSHRFSSSRSACLVTQRAAGARKRFRSAVHRSLPEQYPSFLAGDARWSFDSFRGTGRGRSSLPVNQPGRVVVVEASKPERARPYSTPARR